MKSTQYRRNAGYLNLALGIVLLTAGSVFAEDAHIPAVVTMSTSAPVPTPVPLQNPFESKLRMEDSVEVNNPFGVVPHRPNYLLPYSYNTRPNQDAFRSQSNGKRLQNAVVFKSKV